MLRRCSGAELGSLQVCKVSGVSASSAAASRLGFTVSLEGGEQLCVVPDDEDTRAQWLAGLAAMVAPEAAEEELSASALPTVEEETAKVAAQFRALDSGGEGKVGCRFPTLPDRRA